MCGQDRPGLKKFPLAGALLGGVLVFVCGAIYAQTAPEIVPRVTGAAAPMGDVPAPPLARPIVDDKRLMRNYPEQPPIIPHSIENCQLTLKANRCLDCHRRQYTEGSGAPMISVTHGTVAELNDLIRDSGGLCDLIFSRRHLRIRHDVRSHLASPAWPRKSRRPSFSSDPALVSYRAVPTHRRAS